MMNGYIFRQKKVRALIIVSILLISLFSIRTTLAQDSVRQVQTKHSVKANAEEGTAQANTNDDEFNVFLLLFGVAAVCFMGGFVVIGVIAAMLLLAMIAAMVITGILSVSIVTGWYKKSVTKGVKTFFISAGMITGTVLGMFGFGLMAMIFQLTISQRAIAISGSIIGFIGGAFVGWITFKILQKGLLYAKNKMIASKQI